MRKLQNLCGIVVALALVLSLTFVPTSSVTAQDTTPPRQFKEVPQEIKDLFEGGMPIEEFLAMHNGPIPFALQDYAETEVTVIVEMTQPSLAAKMVADKKLPSTMSPLIQSQYVNTLKQAHKPVQDKVLAVQGQVLGEFTKSYNGLMVHVAAKDLAAIRALPGVKAVHRAPEYTFNMDVSVPLIGADYVQDDLGFTGEGVTIAVIDTGIDYTHASFGGAGTAAAYAANDPDVIEAGSFPTAKVIGGWDFAGTGYDASGDYGSPVPVPDPDPLDEGGHGTHVSSTAAGMEVTGKIGVGVAPDASLYALKVFGAEGSTNLTMNAIEWAMDPNGDGDIADHVDVINMSLGSSFGPADPNDPDIIASNNAVAIGIIVVASSGNAGNSSYITGSPAAASGNISVAASTTGSAKLPFVKNGATEVPYLPANPFTSAAPVVLVDVDMVDDTGTGLLCTTTGVTAGALTGKLALIQRTGCDFSVKINNAASLGAVGAIIYNAPTSTNEFISMAVGTATLPAGSTLNSYGVILKTLHNLEVAVGPDTNVKRFDSVLPADYVADFSSRGPRGTDSMLKPEITAPGVAIFAAQMGSGSEGVSFNGTSMAAPHVAGVAALMRQAHPDWTVEQVKAAMMNTAVDLADELPDEQDVPRTGAGRVDAAAAVETEFVAAGDEDLVSLSWGLIELDVDTPDYISPDVKTVRVYNFTDADVTFELDYYETSSMPWIAMGFEMPPSVTVPAHGWQAFPVILHLLPFSSNYDFAYAPIFGVLPETFGFVTLSPDSGGDDLRVPFYFVSRPISKLTVSGTPDLTVDANGLGEAEIVLDQTGTTAGNLWAFPAFHVDGNELNQLDEADQRMIGIDFVETIPDDPDDPEDIYGDIFSVAINTWGSVHDPQLYFAEHDIYIDADQDGVPETANLNYDFGAWMAGDFWNYWYVLTIDYVADEMFLGSPYGIWTDFNTGIMELPLASEVNYVDSMGTPGADTDFNFWVNSYDYNGNRDSSPVMYFDTARPPFGIEIDDEYPEGSSSTLSAWVNDLGGYLNSQPKGVMLIDYHGKPGAGQAYFWPLTVVDVPTLYLPLVGR